MNREPVKIALIGYGGMGKTHIDNIQTMDGVRVSDICTLNTDAQAEIEALGATYYADYAQMLRESQADVVLVCTPTHLHTQQVRQALLAGKHCICEKPLCLSAREAEALFDLARKQGVHLYVAHLLLFWEEYMALTELVRSGRYGRVLDMELHRLSERPAWSSTGWLFEREKSGLIPFDLHIHDLYFLISLFGKPRIGHVQHGGRAQAGYDEYLRVNYEYPDLTACAEASWYDAPLPFKMGFRVYFEEAVVCLNEDRLVAYERGGGERRLVWHERREALETSINVSPTSAFLHEMEHFVNCVARGVPSDVVVPEQVIWTMETLEELTARMDANGCGGADQ